MIAFWVAVVIMVIIAGLLITDQVLQALEVEKNRRKIAELLADENEEVWIIY